MNSKEWSVVITHQAHADIARIFTYIADELQAIDNAIHQTDRIYDHAAKLNRAPHGFGLLKMEPWRSDGVRLLPVDNFIIYFVPIDDRQIVYVWRVLYKGMDTQRHLGRFILDIE